MKIKNNLVLIYVSSLSSGRMLARLANYLYYQGRNVAILCDNKEIADSIKNNMLGAINLKSLDDDFFLNTDNSEIHYPYFNKIRNRRLPKEDLNVILAHYTLLKKNLNDAKKIIEYFCPNLLMLAEDGISGNCFLIKAAQKKGINILEVPYGFESSTDFDNSLAIKSRANELVMCEGSLGAVIAKRYPHWIKKGNYAGALMYIPAYIIAREELGLGVINPWTIHGGMANKMAVESQQMYDHYLNEHVPKKKLALTGTIYCDLLFEELKNPLYFSAYKNSHKIENETTSLLVSWLPSYHAERSHHCEFISYEELIIQFFGYLKTIPNVKMTISLHPAMSEEHKNLIKDMGVTISEEYIINLIPKHDIYISCFSTTIRWAIAVGKPVVNYDFYKFNLPDYEKVPSVLNPHSFDEFKSITNQLIENNSYYSAIAIEQNKHANYWGILDGNNAKRINELITHLLPS